MQNCKLSELKNVKPLQKKHIETLLKHDEMLHNLEKQLSEADYNIRPRIKSKLKALKQTRRTHLHRIRKHILASIDILTRAIQILPQEQASQVFTPDTLGRLWEALFKSAINRKQLTAIAHNFILTITTPPVVNKLAPKEKQLLTYAKMQDITQSIQAILLASMFQT